MSGYAISNWQDAKSIYDRLANLTSKPIYSISDDELKRVLEHFETKCAKAHYRALSYRAQPSVSRAVKFQIILAQFSMI